MQKQHTNCSLYSHHGDHFWDTSALRHFISCGVTNKSSICVHRLLSTRQLSIIPPVMFQSVPGMSMFRFCWLFTVDEKNRIVTSPVVDANNVSIGTRKTLLSRKEVNVEAIFSFVGRCLQAFFLSEVVRTLYNWKRLFRSEREPSSCRL